MQIFSPVGGERGPGVPQRGGEVAELVQRRGPVTQQLRHHAQLAGVLSRPPLKITGTYFSKKINAAEVVQCLRGGAGLAGAVLGREAEAAVVPLKRLPVLASKVPG